MAIQLDAHPTRARQLDVCPWCGQELLDHDAVHHVEESERKYERELEIAANAKAEQLATELTRKKDVQLEGLQQQLTEEQDKLAEERARHAEALRDQKAKLRDDAEREAARKVRADLLKKERLITGLKEEIDEQSRRIEHLTADERGEMNEELLLAQLQAAFPDDRIERVGRGRTGGDILHEIRVVRGRPCWWRCTSRTSARTHSVGRTASWSRRERRRTHQTPYLVIVTGAFPRGEKMLCVRDGVVVVHPARLLNLARVMRRMVEEVHRAALTSEGQDAKGAELCAFLSSVEFRQAFDAPAGSSDSSRACSARSERGTSGLGAATDDLRGRGQKDRCHRHPDPNHHREDGRRQTSREVRDMALLERLFHGKPKQEILYPGDERLDVVGEWYHQDALEDRRRPSS